MLESAHLVGEGAGHDKGGVAGGAAQVEQAALRQHNHAVAVRVDEAVHLRLYVLPLHSYTQQSDPSDRAQHAIIWALNPDQQAPGMSSLCDLHSTVTTPGSVPVAVHDKTSPGMQTISRYISAA